MLHAKVEKNGGDFKLRRTLVDRLELFCFKKVYSTKMSFQGHEKNELKRHLTNIPRFSVLIMKRATHEFNIPYNHRKLLVDVCV